MALRGLVVGAVLLAGLVLAWQKQDVLLPWFRQARSDAEAGARSVTGPVSAKPTAGGLRKCVKGQQVSYTNVECPAGFKPQAVTEAAVTVVPATPAAKPPAEAGSAASPLHEALGMTRDDKLRDKIMQRAVEGPR